MNLPAHYVEKILTTDEAEALRTKEALHTALKEYRENLKIFRVSPLRLVTTRFYPDTTVVSPNSIGQDIGQSLIVDEGVHAPIPQLYLLIAQPTESGAVVPIKLRLGLDGSVNPSDVITGRIHPIKLPDTISLEGGKTFFQYYNQVGKPEGLYEYTTGTGGPIENTSDPKNIETAAQILSAFAAAYDPKFPQE